MKLIIGSLGFTLYIVGLAYYFSLIDPGQCVKSHLEMRHHRDMIRCLPDASRCYVSNEDWIEEVCDKWEK